MEQQAKRGRGERGKGKRVISAEIIAEARATGLLPHEFLLKVSRGELISTLCRDPVTGIVTERFEQPDLEMRIDCAKAAAPYFAPKLSNVEFTQAISDEELDKLIVGLAAQAGLGFGTGGEGETPEEQGAPGAASQAAHRVRRKFVERVAAAASQDDDEPGT